MPRPPPGMGEGREGGEKRPFRGTILRFMEGKPRGRNGEAGDVPMTEEGGKVAHRHKTQQALHLRRNLLERGGGENCQEKKKRASKRPLFAGKKRIEVSEKGGEKTAPIPVKKGKK